jgi:hypothetical protein
MLQLTGCRFALMRSGLNSRLKKKHGRIVRGVAIFFMLFTAADLTMPQYFCGDEMGGLPDSISYSVSANILPEGSRIAAVNISSSENSIPDQPSDQEPHEEDCFCCCAHVLSDSDFGRFNIFESRLPVASIVSDPLPNPSLNGTYHPPRFA